VDLSHSSGHTKLLNMVTVWDGLPLALHNERTPAFEATLAFNLGNVVIVTITCNNDEVKVVIELAGT
jgi:hypothetical protein